MLCFIANKNATLIIFCVTETLDMLLPCHQVCSGKYLDTDQLSDIIVGLDFIVGDTMCSTTIFHCSMFLLFNNKINKKYIKFTVGNVNPPPDLTKQIVLKL